MGLPSHTVRRHFVLFESRDPALRDEKETAIWRKLVNSCTSLSRRLLRVPFRNGFAFGRHCDPPYVAVVVSSCAAVQREGWSVNFRELEFSVRNRKRSPPCLHE